MQLDLFESRAPGKPGTTNRTQFRTAKAGEFLVAFELMMRGADVSVAAEGLSYDLLADIGGRLVRVQVKTSSGPTDNGRYYFDLKYGSHKGEKKSHRYSESNLDAFALVALDIRKVAFIHIQDVRTAGMKMRPADFMRDITDASFQGMVARILARI